VSGVLCAFRKRALHEAGWRSPETLTDDVEVSWTHPTRWMESCLRAESHLVDPDAGNLPGTLAPAPSLVGRRHSRGPGLSILWAYTIVTGSAFWVIAVIGIPPLLGADLQPHSKKESGASSSPRPTCCNQAPACCLIRGSSRASEM
jgi:hypothetical protein